MPPIVLLHGLMGSGRTWRRQIPWLAEFGEVHTFDAAGHGRPPPSALTTEAFVDDLASFVRALGPAVIIGHSMGALHAWCLAAAHPELVRALVIEDMAPDFRGRTADDWAALMHAWPSFPSADDVLSFFGDVAGQYFLDSFTHGADGYRLHGDVETFRAISSEWGTRHFWDEWDSVSAPSLLIEASSSITPVGQMKEMHRRGPVSTYERVLGAGHLVHDEQPEAYRRAVTEFLRSLLR